MTARQGGHLLKMHFLFFASLFMSKKKTEQSIKKKVIDKLPRGNFVALLVLHAMLNEQKDLSLKVEN